MNRKGNIEELARQRFGEPNIRLSRKSELRFGRKGSVVVDLGNGRYFDHEHQHGGNVLSSVEGNRPPSSSPRRRNQPSRRLPQGPTRLDQNNLAACAIWHQSVPLNVYNNDGAAISENRDTLPALQYLKGRVIEMFPWPETLAFAWLVHPETRQPDVPTLVVARQCPISGLLRGIQRIFLTEGGQKYQDGTVKMSLGRIEGGRSELLPAIGPELAIAEGVESALSAHLLLGIPAWACCGPFPDRFEIPPLVRRVTIVADYDESGTSKRRAHALGLFLTDITFRSVRVWISDVAGFDANDELRALRQ